MTRKSMATSSNDTRQKVAEVLVIDDERNSRGFIKEALENGGFKCSWCVDWRQVFQLLENRFIDGEDFPDVAIIDQLFPSPQLCQMPDQEGIYILRELHKLCDYFDRPQIPALGYTGNLSTNDKERWLAGGAIDFIPKDTFDDRLSFIPELLAFVEGTGRAELGSYSEENMRAKRSEILRRVMRDYELDFRGAACYLNINIGLAEELLRCA